MAQQMLLRPQMLLPIQTMLIGKTESGHKFKTPKLRMKRVQRIPAPGMDLKPPEDLSIEKFMDSIGGDCNEIVDKFEYDEDFPERLSGMEAVFKEDGQEFKNRGIPTKQRRYLLSKFTALIFLIPLV